MEDRVRKLTWDSFAVHGDMMTDKKTVKVFEIDYTHYNDNFKTNPIVFVDHKVIVINYQVAFELNNQIL